MIYYAYISVCVCVVKEGQSNAILVIAYSSVEKYIKIHSHLLFLIVDYKGHQDALSMFHVLQKYPRTPFSAYYIMVAYIILYDHT